LIGTLLAAGGTLALNQYWERDVDARMDRTRARPLPAGVCSRWRRCVRRRAHAARTAYLAALVGALAALVTAATAILICSRTRRSSSGRRSARSWAPCLVRFRRRWMGGRARRGLVRRWVLFGVLFLWQLPHTLSIARLYRDDYARAACACCR